MSKDYVSMTVRLRREDLELFQREAEAAGVSGGGAARMTIQLFAERLRTNGGDYLEALITMRDALFPSPSKEDNNG